MLQCKLCGSLKIEITGAKQEAKTRLSWSESKRTSKKRCIFLVGEVFFLLTGPLMGDPVAVNNQ